MHERRAAFRMRAQPGREQVLLRCDGRDRVVQLRDESASGLSILCDGNFRLEEGQTVQIRTPSGWFEVTVARLEAVTGGLLVGLRRGAEIVGMDRGDGQGLSRWTLAAAVAMGIVTVPAAAAVWAFCRPTPPAVAPIMPVAVVSQPPQPVSAVVPSRVP